MFITPYTIEKEGSGRCSSTSVSVLPHRRERESLVTSDEGRKTKRNKKNGVNNERKKIKVKKKKKTEKRTGR